jgi:hypothetical protein
MTYDHEAAKAAYKNAVENPDVDPDWMTEGEHTCVIDDAYVDNDKEGVPCLFLWLKEIGTGAKGQIRQSFNPAYAKWLAKLIDTLGTGWKDLDEIEDNYGTLMGMVVEVNTVKKGQYTNHYINAVIEKPEAPEPTPEVNEDDIPF